MTDSNLIKHWIRPEIRELSAYHVPDPAGMIKLDAMENPYTWPDEMISEWQGILKDIELNRYPDPSGQQLVWQIRKSFSIPDDMAILLGNGSDELIQMIALAVADKDRVILAPEPGFVMYSMIARFVGMQYVGVPLIASDFSLDMNAMRQAIESRQPAVIFLAYPNNPTGNLFDAGQVREILNIAPGLVVLDEAYTAFAEDTFMPSLGQYSNLLVMRTVSKMGLAGLRLGYLAGPGEWLGQFDKTRLPYNINVLTQASVAFALRHKDVLDQQTEALKRERSRLFHLLQTVPGLEACPSQANFILFRVMGGQADDLFEGLKKAGILIKNLSRSGDLLADCLRVTVGKPEENDRFLEAIRVCSGVN